VTETEPRMIQRPKPMPEAILLARRFQPYGAQGYRIVVTGGGTLLVGGARGGAARSVTLLPALRSSGPAHGSPSAS
jgi:hypothetical protein